MDEELHSPFLEKPVPCPACGTGSPQRTFRSRLFAPEGKESERALEESGIEHALVQRLKEEGGLLEGFGKKKRRFF